MSNEEQADVDHRTMRAHEMLLTAMEFINDAPEIILPALAYLTSYTMCEMTARQGYMAALALAANNMAIGADDWEAKAKAGKRRKRGMNKRAAVKAVEDLLKGQQP